MSETSSVRQVIDVPATQKLQTVPVDTTSKGRIVIRLNFEVDSEKRRRLLPSYLATHASAVMRMYVQMYKDGDLNLSDLIEKADSISVDLY